MATALTPQTEVTSGKAYRKQNRLKTQLNNLYIFFNFIKSETNDSFVNHFDGHFAYLKTLDFYFNPFTAPACKISARKMHARTCKQYIFRSYNASTFNAMHFDENRFTCLC